MGLNSALASFADFATRNTDRFISGTSVTESQVNDFADLYDPGTLDGWGGGSDGDTSVGQEPTNYEETGLPWDVEGIVTTVLTGMALIAVVVALGQLFTFNFNIGDSTS